MMTFVLKLMIYALKMIDFVFKMMILSLKIMTFVAVSMAPISSH